MKVLSIKIKDLDRFKEGIEISFEANKKRADNSEQVHEGILSWGFLLGRNASGKSSVYRAISLYFLLFKKETKYPNSNFNSLSNPRTGIGYEDYLLMNSTFKASTSYDELTGKNSKNAEIYRVLKDMPEYEVTYIENGEKIIHKVKILDNLVTFEEEIIVGKEINTEYTNRINNWFKKPRINTIGDGFITSSFDDEDILKNYFHSSRRQLIKSLKNFIYDTIESLHTPKAKWDETTHIFLKKLFTNKYGDKEKIYDLFIYLAQKADPCILSIDSFVGVPTFKMSFNKGEETTAITDLSTGTRNTLYFIARMINVAYSKNGALFIQDEVETHLHQELAGILISNAGQIKNFQGFATSNTPDIFDFYRYDSIYLIHAKDDGVKKVERFLSREKGFRPDTKISNNYYKDYQYNPK